MSQFVAQGELRLAAEVAWLYHRDGMKQTAIAKALHISQSRVSRLLRTAEREGIVRTTVHPPEGVFTELENEVREAFHLKQCILTESRESEEATLSALGLAASSYLRSTLLGGEMIGISTWSATWLSAAQNLSPFKEPVAKSIVQLVGGAGSSAVQAQATWLLTRLAEVTGSTPVFLQSPGIVRDARMRQALLADPSVALAAAAWESLSTVLLGVGSVEPSPLLKESGNVLPEVEASVKARGGIGDICFHYFDEGGAVVMPELSQRVVGISEAQLRAVPRRVVAAGGVRKQAAMAATLRGGWANVVITDTGCAKAALESIS